MMYFENSFGSKPAGDARSSSVVGDVQPVESKYAAATHHTVTPKRHPEVCALG